MNPVVRWDDDQQNTLYVALPDQVGIGRTFNIIQECTILLDSVEHGVHFIIDFRDCHTLARQTLASFTLLYADSLLDHPQAGIMVIVGSTLVQRLAAQYAYAHDDLYTAATLADAHHIIGLGSEPDREFMFNPQAMETLL